MKRWLLLLAGAAAAAAVLAMPRHEASRPQAAPVAAALPGAAFRLIVDGAKVEPETASVPKDHRVEIAIANNGADTARVTLAGYERQLAIPPIAPGRVWKSSFVTDRPGEGFPWLVDGRPAGRLAVTGSHLEEGHQ